MKRKLKGFTLVELVITIAIVIILSLVSAPIYRNYVDKAIAAEGVALLGSLYSAEKAYYAEYGNFYTKTITTSYDQTLGVDARGNKYFSIYSIMGSTSGWTIICNGAGSAEGFAGTIIA